MKKILARIPLWLKIVVGVLLFFVVLQIALWLLPNSTLKAFEARQYSSRFYDRNGELLYILPLDDGLRREYCSLDSMPEELVNQFLEAEDKNFYFHPGVDPFSIVRAISQNKSQGRVVSGASTITMQLVRLIWPRQKNAPVTLGVKIKEMFQAFYLEAKYSKKKILELYLNNVPFGFQVEGVQSAARSFYGVELEDLSKAQMEVLAKIPRRPSDYAPQKIYEYKKYCPHFIDYVVSDYAVRGDVIPYELHLSIDSVLTAQTEIYLQRKLTEYQDARVHNGAAFVLDNRTGEILVYVGNASYEDETHGGQIDGVQVKNQPGSSMKPFLYALNLEQDFSPNSILPDIPMDFGGSGVYVPFNFNNKYNGPVPYRVSLASSLNVPAVYLLYCVGVDAYMERLYSLGYDSLLGTRDSTGLSLALGSSEVTLNEMVRAFSVFPRDGYLINQTYLKTNIPDAIENEVQCFREDTARIICNMLSDKSARSLGFGFSSIFDTPYPCIFKTGTSNQYQNIIALGATSEFTAGVWMGNFEGETVIKQTGSSIPATVVRSLLDELNEWRNGQSFNEPEHYQKMNVCSLSGMKPGAACPSITQEYINKDHIELFESETCSWHYMQNGRVQIVYPSEYQHWATNRNKAGSFSSEGNLEIVYPRNNASFLYDPLIPTSAQEMSVEAIGGGDDGVELYVDGVFFGKKTGLLLWHVPLELGEHTITVSNQTESYTVSYSVGL